MTKVKGNSRDAITQRGLRDGEAKGKKRKRFNPNEKRPRRGPRPFRRELQLQNPTVDEEDSDIDSDFAVGNDVYEYEEGIAEEESMKNKRYDRVQNFDYDLPENFEDWVVESDKDVDDDDDPGRHDRMLEEITGLSADAFGGSRKKKDFIISEAYPESEFNPSNGDGQISMSDLLDPLHGKFGSSKLKKDLHRMEKKSIPTLAPLPKSDQQRVERKAAYEHFKKDITRWEPLVKRNREAPTLYFDEDVDLGFSTIGAIASQFKPRTDFEKKMASLVNQTEVVEAATLLEPNEISVEERKARQEWNAKRRSLLSRYGLKSKRIKKIKSKTNHRRSRKDRMKAVSSIQMDPEVAKEHAMRLEFKRAEERMTLKHKNSSKWAKRILKRGLQNQDEATRAAFNELHDQHAALTRKVNSIRESSGSDDSSDDMSADSDEDATEKLIEKAKKKTLQVLEGDDELPTSGVLSLPFMVRGMQKKKLAVEEEARLALEEYEKLGDKSKLGSSDKDVHASGGRRVFGVPKKLVNEARKKDKYSDGESDVETMENDVSQHDQTGKITNEPDINPSEEFGFSHDSVFTSFGNAAEPKTTYEVSYLGSDSWKKVKKSSDTTFEGTEDNQLELIAQIEAESEENDEEDSDTDSGGEMVDGVLSSGPKSTYEVPSQVELIRRAFAGDDVEGEFAKEKDTVLDEENPEAEKPVLVPGWGQWTDIQEKKGLPCWMLKKHVAAKNERLESLKKRKDAGLNHVIISEKLDKKVEKLHTKRLPYPYTSKEVFEQSIRMPIGPEFNPVTAIGALNHPEVVKKAGVIIKPIQFNEDASGGKPGKKVQRI